MQHLIFTDVIQKYLAKVDKGDVDGVVELFEVDAESDPPIGFNYLGRLGAAASGLDALSGFGERLPVALGRVDPVELRQQQCQVGDELPGQLLGVDDFGLLAAVLDGGIDQRLADFLRQADVIDDQTVLLDLPSRRVRPGPVGTGDRLE